MSVEAHGYNTLIWFPLSSVVGDSLRRPNRLPTSQSQLAWIICVLDPCALFLLQFSSGLYAWRVQAGPQAASVKSGSQRHAVQRSGLPFRHKICEFGLMQSFKLALHVLSCQITDRSEAANSAVSSMEIKSGEPLVVQFGAPWMPGDISTHTHWWLLWTLHRDLFMTWLYIFFFCPSLV